MYQACGAIGLSAVLALPTLKKQNDNLPSDLQLLCRQLALNSVLDLSVHHDCSSFSLSEKHKTLQLEHNFQANKNT